MGRLSFRGYVASRPVRGEFTPQHVQNLVIRDYAARHDLAYLLSATEYSMSGCYMILESALDELESIDGLILFSLFMLPASPPARQQIYDRVLASSRSLHFALEDLAFGSALDVDRLEDMFRVEAASRREVRSDELDPLSYCPLCGCLPAQAVRLGCGGVSSDVRPWPRLAELLACAGCGAIYKRADHEWQSDVEKIYASYSAYHQAAGAERKVADGDALSPRSALLATFAGQHHSIGESGRVLDVGCGNGAFLRAFAAHYPSWTLVGVDRADGGGDSVRSLGATFIHGDITCAELAAGEKFDIISLVHVLEHVSSPVDWLTSVQTLLKPGGVVVLDAPNVTTNPFDLAVVDHVLHFDRQTLGYAAARARFRIIAYSDQLIAKEHVALITPTTAAPLPLPGPQNPVDLCYLERLASWLEGHEEINGPSKVGVLGTGIAATWVAGVLGERLGFFVDEDPLRRQKPYLGREVRSALEALPNEVVVIAQPPALSRSIANRLRQLASDVRWLEIPELENRGE